VHREEGPGHATIWIRHRIRERFILIIAGCRHKNRDKIYLGPKSARLRSRGGDNRFWVIRCQELSGVVCFLMSIDSTDLLQNEVYLCMFPNYFAELIKGLPI